MLFSVEYDSGEAVGFYLVPDSGGTAPSVRLLDNGTELKVVAANQERPELVGAGRHATGMCGFVIDESVLPGIEDLATLDIEEAETGLIIYRRPRDGFLKQKVFRLETHLLPLWRIDDFLKGHFQYWYRGIDRRGLETASQAFCVVDLESAYISGRLFVKTVEQHLHDFQSVVLFRDPYEELAERLIILKNATPKTKELLGARDAITFEPVIEQLAELERFDEEGCRRFFRRSHVDVIDPLKNPFTRQLTCTGQHDLPRKNALAQSLTMLAGFEVVSLRSDAAHFSEALGEMLGLDGRTVPVMNEYGRVTELAQTLRTVAEVEGVLEHDLAVFEQISHAFGSIGSAG